MRLINFIPSGFYFNNLNAPLNTTHIIVTAGTNVNGIIFRGANLTFSCNAENSDRVVDIRGAPAGISFFRTQARNLGNVNFFYETRTEKEVYIPAGNALQIETNSDSGAAMVALTTVFFTIL